MASLGQQWQGQQQQQQQQHEAQEQLRRDIIKEQKNVTIRNPGYPDESDPNVLFRLYVFDNDNGVPGLDYRTAVIAYAIVANNA